ncbi:cystatin-B-like [Siphateles boraxobius]|uniref:cystatin-B-like n=1 Tax=Siphateles boraxobius TaxID=180520 RepID=UPI004063D29A
MTDAAIRPGGWSTEGPANGEVENICIEAGKQAGVHFDVCIPKTFKHQIVAGTNYLVKVKVGVEKYLHVMIFQALPCDGGKLSVTRVQYPKTKSDPLVPF